VVYYFTEYNLLAGLIIGATLGGTSSAVVIPMVRQLKLGIKSKTILILESALTDVFCIIVVLALIEFELLGELKFGLMVGKILSSFLVALLIGCLGGLIWSILLNKIRNLHNSILTTPAFVMILYGIIEILGFSGPIGALAFGVTLANIELFKLPVITQLSNLKPITLNDTEKIMFSEIVFLLKTFFFIYIGISIQFTSVGSILFALVFTFGLLALRIIVVRFTYDKSISKRDASLSSIMMPRGLVAAVLASIPLQRGVVSGEFIQTVAYNVVLLSILLSSIMVFTIERTKLFRLFEWCFYGFSPSEKENVTQKKDGGHG